MGRTTYLLAAGVALGAAAMLVWAMLAVGVLAVEGDPADLMYIGVFAVGIGGAIIARFRPRGMAHAMFAAALAQAFVAVIALIAGLHLSPVSSVYEVIGVNAIFVVMFAASALLFLRAAKPPRAGAVS